MARGINKVIVVGICGQDPEVRYTPTGKVVTTLSLATGEQWTDKQTGQKVERTEWHRVVLFDRVGEIAGEYLRKGAQVYIEGRLQTREWEKDGIKRYATEILVDQRGRLQLLGSKPQAAAGTDQAGTAGAPPAARRSVQASAATAHNTNGTNTTHPEQDDDFFDDGIPF